MAQFNDGPQLEVHLAYYFTNNEWHRLPNVEIIRIVDERERYKISRTTRYGGDTSSVEIIEITTENENGVNTVQGRLQILQQRISELETESHAGESGRPPSSIVGGHNERANLRSRNQYGDWSIRKIKVQISSQSSSKCMISEPHPGTLATNEIDSNEDMCCLGTNFIVMTIIERTANLYP